VAAAELATSSSSSSSSNDVLAGAAESLLAQNMLAIIRSNTNEQIAESLAYQLRDSLQELSVVAAAVQDLLQQGLTLDGKAGSSLFNQQEQLDARLEEVMEIKAPAAAAAMAAAESPVDLLAAITQPLEADLLQQVQQYAAAAAAMVPAMVVGVCSNVACTNTALTVKWQRCSGCKACSFCGRECQVRILVSGLICVSSSSPGVHCHHRQAHDMRETGASAGFAAFVTASKVARLHRPVSTGRPS
jgi:hypothetical protein